jgi:hypothetical protein
LVFTPFDATTLASTHAAADLLRRSAVVMLYVGPDQIMPLASMLSAIVGVALMFWRRLVGAAVWCWGLVRRRPQPAASEPPVEDRA